MISADIPGKWFCFPLRRSAISSWPKATLSALLRVTPSTHGRSMASTIRFKSTAKFGGQWMTDRWSVIHTDSMWRRMKLIPFLRKFEEGKMLTLIWLTSYWRNYPAFWIERSVVWFVWSLAENLPTQMQPSEAKRQCREEANPWRSGSIRKQSKPIILQLLRVSFRNYMQWCIEQNEKPVTSTQFGKDLNA